VDVLAVALVVAFAIRGGTRGAIEQAFTLAGLFAGLALAHVVHRWVGLHWEGARPAVFFGVLRALVAVISGIGAYALLSGWGAALAGSVRDGAWGWLDGLGGYAFGAGLGAVVAALVLVVALSSAWPRGLAGAAARARLTPPLLVGGADLSAAAERAIPFGAWLHRRFLSASERARELAGH
jgi:hypothetical protein